MTLKDKIAQIDLDKIVDSASRVKVQAFINKIEAVAEDTPDDAMNLIEGLIGQVALKHPQAIRVKISKAEAQKKVDKIKKMKNIVPQKADIVKIKAQISKQYPNWDDDRVEELANIRIQAQIDRADSFNKMIDNLEKTTLYAGKVSNAPIDYVAPKEPSRVMRDRNLPKDAKTSAVTEAEELRSTGRKYKRKSPTYGKSGGAKRPYYYEYRMNRRDVDNKIQLAKGGYADPENNTHVLHIDGYPYYLEKIDSTHFYMSNAPESRGMAHHIGQHNGEPYYDEVRTWLKETGGQYAQGGNVDADGGEAMEFEIYDEESGKTLFIVAHSNEEAEGISETIDFNDYEEGDVINVLDDIANYDEYDEDEDEYAKGGRLDRVQFTKLATLGYRREAPNQYRFVDLQSTEDLGSPVAVGDIYKTKKELLADLDNFAEIRGYEYKKGGNVEKRYNWRDAKELSEEGRFELKVLQGLSGFNNGLTLNGLYESVGFSNYRFNESASDYEVKKVEEALNSLIKKGFVDESGLGYKITQNGANYRREFDYGSYSQGGKFPKRSMNIEFTDDFFEQGRGNNSMIRIDEFPDPSVFVPSSGKMLDKDFQKNTKYRNVIDGKIYTFSHTDESGRLTFLGSDNIKRIFSPSKMQKYAKGGNVSIPNADKMMHLPMEVAVYVPSTSNVDKEISATEMKARVKEVETYLAELFGGFTSSEKVGGYLSGKSGVITEKVVPVTAFATNESFAKNKSKLVNKLAVWAKKWSQEAMGLEFEGDLYYVPQKFKKGGRLTATYIPNEDIESIKTRFGQTFSGKDVLDGAYVKRKVKTPKVARYMFEEEEYEYAEGGVIFKKGDLVVLKDGGSQRNAVILEDGFDSKNRVRVRPDGIPMDISVPMSEEYSSDKRVYVLYKRFENGGVFEEGNPFQGKLSGTIIDVKGVMYFVGMKIGEMDVYNDVYEIFRAGSLQPYQMSENKMREFGNK